MKQIFLSFFFVASCFIFSNFAEAQVPAGFNYQGIARNASGNPLVSKAISLRLSILNNGTGGTVLYEEVHHLTTSALGYFNIRVGHGTVVSGTFSDINWGKGNSKWLKTEMDPAGGNNYSLLGTSELESVPYALFASKSISSDLTASAPLNISSNNIQINPGTKVGDLISWDGNNWVAMQPKTLADTTVSNLQPYLVLNYCIALQGVFPTRNSSSPFIGEIDIYAFNFAPSGWAQCNGQLLPINQYQALFSLLGTYYGGDGITTFALPNLQGRVPVHVGNYFTQGQTGGSETIFIHR